MANTNDYNNNDDDMANDSMEWKVGRMVTVFTRSGGRSGFGFTGILVEAGCNFIKLITTLPCAPRSPFRGIGYEGGYGGGGGYGYGGGGGGGYGSGCGNRRNPLGTVVVIPRSEIVSYVFNEI